MRNFLKRMRDQRHEDPYSEVLNGWSTREKFRLVGQRWCVRTACVCVSKHVWVCWCAHMVEFVCACVRVCDRRERACLLHLLLSSYSSSIVRRVRKRTCRQLIGPGLAVKTDCRNFFSLHQNNVFRQKNRTSVFLFVSPISVTSIVWTFQCFQEGCLSTRCLQPQTFSNSSH